MRWFCVTDCENSDGGELCHNGLYKVYSLYFDNEKDLVKYVTCRYLMHEGNALYIEHLDSLTQNRIKDDTRKLIRNMDTDKLIATKLYMNTGCCQIYLFKSENKEVFLTKEEINTILPQNTALPSIFDILQFINF